MLCLADLDANRREARFSTTGMEHLAIFCGEPDSRIVALTLGDLASELPP